eukprot:TRINITY_DN22163_c0_g1_i1.p1 TRINITY_DN22163_c0_g1~~TRINITY_DN22163_c0_g1_i1.p1  ORF type:complete len:294 (+),score=66.61 TRINITY_DN22163_c0_g1_i1:25-882(+)
MASMAVVAFVAQSGPGIPVRSGAAVSGADRQLDSVAASLGHGGSSSSSRAWGLPLAATGFIVAGFLQRRTVAKQRRRKCCSGGLLRSTAASPRACATLCRCANAAEKAVEISCAAEGTMGAGALAGPVYLWRTPLVLPAVVPQVVQEGLLNAAVALAARHELEGLAAFGAAGGMAQFLPVHSVVLVPFVDGSGVAAFDFEPKDKEALGTAVRLLLGGSMPGKFGFYRLKKLPEDAVCLGKAASEATTEDITDGLNADFDPMLTLLSNNCHVYASTVAAKLLAKVK